MPKELDLGSAVENLRGDRPYSDEDIALIADSLHRKETNLLALKRAGLPDEVIEACFLLGHCKGSLVHERLESLRANPLARSRKIRELRAQVERADLCQSSEGKWDLLRETFLRALDVLEEGTLGDSFQEKARRPCRERQGDPCEEWGDEVCW